jgi:hypothetical protein
MKTRTYGFDGTIHQTTGVNVEVHDGEVVAVWFRCQPIPFTQNDFGPARAKDMQRLYDQEIIPGILAIEIEEN